MKRNFFRALLLGALFFSHLTVAQPPTQEFTNSVISAAPGQTTGSDTYLLSMALSGTASTYVDMRSQYGLLVCVTGTSNAAGSAINGAGPGVWVEWNNVTYTSSTWFPSGSIPCKTHQFVAKQAKYVRFRVMDSALPTAVTTLFYSLVDAPSAPTVGGIVTVTGNVSNTAGTAFMGSVSVSQPAGVANQIPIDAKGSSVNASGFNFLSFSAMTGLTVGTDTVLSLTWAAGVSTGPVFGDVGCAGATGANFIITNSATVPAGWVANSSMSDYQPCGQISQIPLEWNAANTPHLHAVAVTLSNTSASIGISCKQRP